MFQFYLPYAEKFEKVFLQNEIHEWEAKMFLKNIQNLKGKNSIIHASHIYASLRTLLRHGFLSFKRSESNSRIFLYSETEKLKQNRNHFLNNRLKSIIEIEKDLINKNIVSLNTQKEYLYELLLKYPELNSEFINLDQKIDLDEEKKRAKLNILDSFLKIL